MVITVIHGQQHKGSTYNISKQLLENITDENTLVHEYFMIKDAPGYCTGCFNCIEKGEELCPQFEKINPVVSAIKEADLLIIDSPTYCMGMTGQLKTFFDHLAFMWLSHRPDKTMFTKVAVAVSTAAGAGGKSTTKAIAQQLFWLGVPKVFRYSKNVKASSWKAVLEEIKISIAKQCKKLSKSVKGRIGKSKPKMKLWFMYNIMRKMQKGNDWNMIDRNHWEENGWLAKNHPW
jgi:multimeric flavodoxin WrbA